MNTVWSSPCRATIQKALTLAVLAWFAFPNAVLAKRIPAPIIEPIVHEGVRYTVPNDKGTKGYVVASDASTGKQLWEKTIYRKWICPCVEHDVQWVFIKHMRLDAGHLMLVDERGRSYSLDLKTRSVKRLRQKVISHAGPNPPLQATPGSGSGEFLAEHSGAPKFFRYA